MTESNTKLAEEINYRMLLASHDKYYAYSDDGSVYRKGHAEYQALVKLQKVLDVDKSIWNEYFK